MNSPVSTYGFLNAKLRARISKMIPEETVLQMVEARSFEEAVHVLNTTGYASAVSAYEQTGDLLMTELEIERIQQSVLKETDRYTRQFTNMVITVFTRMVLLRFDLTNLKNALRLWYERTIRGRSIESKLPYLLRSTGVSGLSLESIVNAESIEELTVLTASAPFTSVIEKALPLVVEEHSMFSLEIALDRWYYASLKSSAAALNTRDQMIAERLIGIEIDTVNVNWIVRKQAFYAGVDRGGGITLLSGGLLAKSGVLENALSSNHPARQLSRLFGDRMGVPSELPSQDEDAHAGSTARSLAFLEKLLKQQLLYECRRVLGGYPFTIGVVLAYFALIQQEARRIITVLNGKYYEMAPRQLEALL
ncbi:MAG: V-type ATPase subunit [Spirochaetaceae bacterium]|nr:V-type ATPase subunit [Spirochaetaceae bacterium]